MTAGAPVRAEALDAVGQAFKRTVAALRRMRSREAQHPDELSYAQYGLLFALSDGVALPSREVALAGDVAPATATEMLEGLAAAGLVQRVRSPDDKRVVLTSLTEYGRELVEARRAKYEPRWQAAMSSLSDDELRGAVAVLEAMRDWFDELADGV